DTIDKINTVAKKLAPCGFKFSYHNHGHEFVKFNNKTVLDYIVENTDPEVVSICLDVYFAQQSGMDVRKLIEDLTGRIDIIHLKDMSRNEKEPYIAYIGEGNLNWKGIIESARKSGVKYFVVEQDDCLGRDPFVCLENSFNYLKNL
ncbi:MAG: sugar phosphate isomerase/epimerase, partial [Clostridia bacterium]|nr:sugar phosphate isomerase/epimerase [Clostridia bacterium]